MLGLCSGVLWAFWLISHSPPQLLPVRCSPTASSGAVLHLTASLCRQGRSFKMTHGCGPPNRPAGRQEMSSICCPLSTPCSTPSSSPTTVLRWEKDTSLCVNRHLQTPGQTHHTLSKTLSRDPILIPQQHLAGDCYSKRCHSPLLQSTPISVLFSWSLSWLIGGRRERGNSHFPKGRTLSTLRVPCMESISSFPDTTEL